MDIEIDHESIAVAAEVMKIDPSGYEWRHYGHSEQEALYAARDDRDLAARLLIAKERGLIDFSHFGAIAKEVHHV